MRWWWAWWQSKLGRCDRWSARPRGIGEAGGAGHRRAHRRRRARRGGRAGVRVGTGRGGAGPATAVLPMAELPGFSPPTAVGHTGQLLSVRIGEHRVLVLAGRIHPYEGHDLLHVVHPVRAACAAGAHTIVLTNAAGGLRDDLEVGQPVLISDHLNLTARSPLVGPQFVDLVDAYAPRLRELARQVDPTLTEGVYAGLPGPHYETPAEIRMLRILGADLVGMSTVHETIAARAAGAQVLGVSLVTNLAAGVTGPR
ncbi:purine nucleotide phosphorylase [Mycobacterium xenopi 4042]|uniref:Purine-nucleoside phosphorylase n=1 Tax=Mycobacterium xenopi 4042 TaxID=1299334 RepID=X7YHM0_MYCXE|nr:purine nucleotide phosphorylase [Mycobacterium xenopi 4042]